MINTHSVQWVSAKTYFFEKYPWFLFPERNPSCLARRVLILTAPPQTVRSARTPRADGGCTAWRLRCLPSRGTGRVGQAKKSSLTIRTTSGEIAL